MEQTTDILIIGAGATGLMAGRLLSEKGYAVAFLEARDRIGGRIHTIHENGFSHPVELGAEFVHGDLPLTLDLLKEAGIPYHKQKGEWWQYSQGEFKEEEEQEKRTHRPLFMKKLHALEEDCTLYEFLLKNFPEAHYAALRQSVTRFAEGFDAADVKEISAFSVRDEWKEENEDQYRIEGGYMRLMDYLQEQCLTANARFHLSTVVMGIAWSRGQVTVHTNQGNFNAAKVLVTIPIGALQVLRDSGRLHFSPDIPAYTKAISDIGYGHIIKFLLQFKEAFWRKDPSRKQHLKDLGFLLSDEEIPTWWTQNDKKNHLLTGWLGGPDALAMSTLGKEVLLDKALQSLSRIFKQPVATLQENLSAWDIGNWPSQPYSAGAYSYEKVATAGARNLLLTPIEDTIYFAGEALYHGTAMGTVEAALCNGQQVAKSLAASW